MSRFNRLLNNAHVHKGILGSFFKDGHDETKPNVGVAIYYTSPEGKAMNLADNERLASLSTLHPPVYKGLMSYGAVATTHYNTAIRCVNDNVPSPVGNLKELLEEQESLQKKMHGHTWIVLHEKTAASLLRDISTWRNSSQNQGKPLTEGELFQIVLTVLKDYLERSQTVHLAALTSGACLASAIKLNPALVGAYAHHVFKQVKKLHWKHHTLQRKKYLQK